jgi:autotransporter-associated beta strand protein
VSPDGKLQLSSNTSTYAGPTIIQAGTVVATAANCFGSGSVTVSGSVNALSGTLINFKSGVTTVASSSFVYGAEINQDYMTVTGTLSAPTTTNVAFNTATPGTAYALYQFGTFDRTQVSNIVVSYNSNDIGMIPKTFVLGNRVITKPYGSEAQVVTNLSIPTPSTITLGNNYKYRGTYGLIRYTNFTTSQLSNLTVVPPSGYAASTPFISASAIYVTIS